MLEHGLLNIFYVIYFLYVDFFIWRFIFWLGDFLLAYNLDLLIHGESRGLLNRIIKLITMKVIVFTTVLYVT